MKIVYPCKVSEICFSCVFLFFPLFQNKSCLSGPWLAGTVPRPSVFKGSSYILLLFGPQTLCFRGPLIFCYCLVPDNGLEAVHWILKTALWRLRTGDWALETGHWRLGTGNWRHAYHVFKWRHAFATRCPAFARRRSV